MLIPTMYRRKSFTRSVGRLFDVVRSLQAPAAYHEFSSMGTSRPETPPNSDAVHIFDRDLKRAHRDRAARIMPVTDPLLGEVAERLLDRLEDCKRAFPAAAILGGAGIEVASRLINGRGGHRDPHASGHVPHNARQSSSRTGGISRPKEIDGHR
eukprot:jgi/Botrbrau1/5621/Bobra.55_1s0010.1